MQPTINSWKDCEAKGLFIKNEENNINRERRRGKKKRKEDTFILHHPALTSNFKLQTSNYS